MRQRHICVDTGLFVSLYVWLITKYFWLDDERKKRLQAKVMVLYGKPPDLLTDLDWDAVIAWFLKHLAHETCKVSIEEPRADLWQITIELPHHRWSRSMTRARLVYEGYAYWVNARKVRSAGWKCYVYDPKKGWTRLIVRPRALSLRVVKAKTVAQRAKSRTNGPVARHSHTYRGIQLREKTLATSTAIAQFGPT